MSQTHPKHIIVMTGPRLALGHKPSNTPKQESFTSRFFGEGGKVAQNGRKEDVREIVLIR